MGHPKSPNPEDEALHEQTSPSTTYGWRYVKIAPGRKAPEGTAPKARFFRGLSRRNSTVPVSLTLKFRGGAEGWVEVHARGRKARYPGSTQVLDILRDINNDW